MKTPNTAPRLRTSSPACSSRIVSLSPRTSLIRLLVLELQHLALHVGGVGRISDVLGDSETILLEQAGDDVRNRGAVFGVFMHQSDVIDLLSAGLHLLEEVEIDSGEISGHRRCPEEPFETALSEI